MTPSSDVGQRLASHSQRLRLLFAHLAGRAIRSRVELDDLVQEVFVRALIAGEALPSADEGDAAMGRYLARIARNVIVDVARSMRARKRDGRTTPLVRSDWSHVGVSESRVAKAATGVLTHLARREEHARLREAFDRLTPEHRRVIGLRQFEGLSARAAAARMGSSETAVHSLYRRALAAWADGSD